MDLKKRGSDMGRLDPSGVTAAQSIGTSLRELKEQGKRENYKTKSFIIFLIIITLFKTVKHDFVSLHI